ncbi:hypothetical protein R5R35_013054 [Gryllus longicercus]|uniref:Target of rapamycin complex 2 subunit MAPKAP1 n=1 Tax=Gryllus longicercus TaxID=2509291 RepID=A0AAN9V4N8_9ORTH
MALYDNKHWLLSHIKNSFISSDDTGICEMVMLGEDIPRSLSHATKVCCYPGADQSEGEDEMDVLSHSLDMLAEMDLGVRQRPTTVQRLEKNDPDHEKADRTRFVKWENVTGYDPSEFQRKDFRKKRKDEKINSERSLLVKQLENYPSVFRNPFLDYAKFDGDAQVGVPTRRYGIFMMMLPPAERNYPLNVVVIASARVQDLIGLICWKHTMEHGDHNLGDSVDQYGLYIAEDDGEVDWDFPCLDPREVISKFGFSYLALVERKEKVPSEDSATRERNERLMEAGGVSEPRRMKAVLKDEDMQRMKGHMTAMEAPLYQSYRVCTVSKVRSRTEIQLGISGEKIEIDPVVQQRVGAKFWNRQKAVSYDIDNIAACEIIDNKTNNRGTLRLTYYSPSLTNADQDSSLHNHASISHYKHYDFETDLSTAEEIVQKINNILDLTTPIKRQEYLDLRESKPHKKRMFRLGQKQ